MVEVARKPCKLSSRQAQEEFEAAPYMVNRSSRSLPRAALLLTCNNASRTSESQ